MTSGCSAAWQRASFGTKRSWVQIPPPRHRSEALSGDPGRASECLYSSVQQPLRILLIVGVGHLLRLVLPFSRRSGSAVRQPLWTPCGSLPIGCAPSTPTCRAVSLQWKGVNGSSVWPVSSRSGSLLPSTVRYSRSGWLALLIGWVEYDMGDRAATESTRRAALPLAREADNSEITGWAHEMRAWFALTTGNYRGILAAIPGRDWCRTKPGRSRSARSTGSQGLGPTR